MSCAPQTLTSEPCPALSAPPLFFLAYVQSVCPLCLFLLSFHTYIFSPHPFFLCLLPTHYYPIQPTCASLKPSVPWSPSRSGVPEGFSLSHSPPSFSFSLALTVLCLDSGVRCNWNVTTLTPLLQSGCCKHRLTQLLERFIQTSAIWLHSCGYQCTYPLLIPCCHFLGDSQPGLSSP